MKVAKTISISVKAFQICEVLNAKHGVNISGEMEKVIIKLGKKHKVRLK